MSNLIASLWRAQTFAFLAYHLSWFLFGFYPCENLELVFISIPSSSSSKTDFILISSGVFDVGGFTGSSFLERSNSLLVVSSSHDGLWCVYAWSCSACDYLRNKPKIIENGVRMKTCLHSRLWKYYRFIREESSTPSHVCQLNSFMVLNISNKIGFTSFGVRMRKFFQF